MTGKTWVMHKKYEQKQDVVQNSSSLYKTYTPIVIFKNITLKEDHHTGVKWFIHGPKCCKEY